MLKDRDSKQSIQVTIRVRPLSEKELSEDSRTCVKLEQINSLHLTSGGEVKKFTFDSICFNESQQSIFQRVGKRCTIDCLEGYNCTVFAYGQTGAGKTYTMMGVNFQHQNYHEHRGLIPRTMQFLFDCIDQQRENGVNFIIRCSFLEIYNEQIIDLLNKSNTNLQLRQDTRKGVYVEGITQEVITRSDEAMQILNKGSKSRHVGSTFYNQTSSRSHSVFTMQIESKYTKNGVSNTKSRQFNFIDLAGSERTKQSTGERLKEGCNINKSLMNLAAVINALSEVSQGKSQHVNYRNSKLTFLLKDSLGGNSKTNLIANISPATVFYQQTLSTLGFARRAKLIKRQKASINQDSSGNLESMKNEIKRLKQQVISLMSRLESGSVSPSMNGCIQPQKPNQMTAIMHQYVEEEIDKQTRLELEILKLNDRIIHLQNGIKQYSNNQIHLRMIISVYEDKINRLKNIEKTINQNLSNLSQNDEESKAIITYFKNERSNFIKELQSIRMQSDNNKFLKELLKEAKIMKDDGQDESLKDLLVKNTNFLNNIRSKLDEMKPEKIEFEINSQFQKKINLMQQLYQKKEEEYQERLQQINLDLADFKNRNEESQKLLEESISGHIALQEKIRQEREAKEKLMREVEMAQDKLRLVENAMSIMKSKSQQCINELKTEATQKENQIVNSRKQIQSLKLKIEKVVLHQTALKTEFENLQEEKYRLDKQLLQNIDELRELKNAHLKSQSQITVLQQKIQLLISENSDLKTEHAKVMEAVAQKQIGLKLALEQAERNHQVQLEAKIKQVSILEERVKSQEVSIKLINQKLSSDSEEYTAQLYKYKQMQQEYEMTIASKEQQLREMLILVNQKELNDNEANVQLNQLKIELINAHSEKETLEAKYKQSIEELKEKLIKQQSSLQMAEHQIHQNIQLYDSLSLELNSKKKECSEISESLTRIQAKVTLIQEQSASKDESINELTNELEALKTKDKQQRLSLNQMKNELFLLQRNSQIEMDALNSQNTLKDQQIQQIGKQIIKNKQKYEKKINQLQKQIQILNESIKNQEDSFTKTMESHLIQKQRKITQLKQISNHKDQKIQQLTDHCNQLQLLNATLNDLKTKQATQIVTLQASLSQMKEYSQQLKQEVEQLKINHQKQVEDMQIVHNQQIDQKNQLIESYMIQNETIQTRLQENMTQFQNVKNINASLMTEINIKNENYKAVHSQIVILQTQMLAIKEEYQNYVSSQSKESSQAFKKYQQELQLAKQRQTQRQIMLQDKQNELKSLYMEKQELINCTRAHQNEIERLNSESSSYVSTISLLTQENYGLNQQINDYFNNGKEKENKIAHLESLLQHNIQEKSIFQQKNISLSQQLHSLQEIDLENRGKLVKLDLLTNELTKSLESERQAASLLMASKTALESNLKALQESLVQKQLLLTRIEQQMKTLQVRQASVCKKLEEVNGNYLRLAQQNQEKMSQNKQLAGNYQSLIEKYRNLDSQFSKTKEELKSTTNMYEQLREKQGKELNSIKTQNTFLIDENRKQASDVICLNKALTDLKNENTQAKQRIIKFQQHHQKLTTELEELHLIKQQWELQANEFDKIRNQIEEERSSKERIYTELTREKQSNASLKLLIDNKSAQYAQLQVQLQEKDAIYKKLVEKIAKNESESKKTTNSEHYLKTIQLLEKSRAQQIELRRQNEELKKVMLAMKEGLEQKDAHVREVQQKSQNYCVSMHKRLEEIQNDYVQLERTHEKLIKERKMYSHENQQLKEQVKILKTNTAKLSQKHEEMQAKIKKANLDYLQLEKDYDQLKRMDNLIPANNDEKTNIVNRLKIQIAALKTEKVLLSETLTKERQQKTKLKAQMRYGKEGGGQMVMKLELEKKINENKNLTELIFQVISQLKICVNQPKAKLEVIRTIILGAIKDKNTQIKTLKEKVRECEADHQRSKPQYHTRQLKALSISNSNRPIQEAPTYKFDKEKDPTYLTNNSRNKLKEFEKYYAKFKTNDAPVESKGKN